MSLIEINDNEAELTLKSKNKKEYKFLISKFNLEDALDISLAVHRDVLSLLPVNIHDSIHFENLRVSDFKDTMKQAFKQTYLQPQGICCSDLSKVNLPLDLLIPLFMEVIKYNDFFILLGIENTILAMMEFLQISIERFEIQLLTQTSQMQEQIIEFSQAMEEIEQQENNIEEAQTDLQSLTISNE